MLSDLTSANRLWWVGDWGLYQIIFEISQILFAVTNAFQYVHTGARTRREVGLYLNPPLSPMT